MYSLRALLQKNPVQIGFAIRAVLGALIIGGTITLTAEEVAGYGIALEAVLGLFVYSQTVNAAKLEEVKDVTAAVAQEAARSAASRTVAAVNTAVNKAVEAPPPAKAPARRARRT